MGIRPLEFLPGESWESCDVRGDEEIEWPGVPLSEDGMENRGSWLFRSSLQRASVLPTQLRCVWISTVNGNAHKKAGMFSWGLDTLLPLQ